MGYIGENSHFSFRVGVCETLPERGFPASDAAYLGRVLAGQFGRFIAGCDGFSQTHLLYALCSGLSECGREVYICENTDMPSFRFSMGLLGADIGVFISRGARVHFFCRNGFPLGREKMTAIMNGTASPRAEKCGRISPVTSFREIYVGNIADSAISGQAPAGVSCGAASVRTLWERFMTGSDELVFQVSDDGSRVNAYSALHGFIPHERLIMAYAAILAARGETVYLPDHLHYAAEEALPDGCSVVRFDPSESVPDGAVKQRFLADPLFMSASLTSDIRRFNDILRGLPPAASVRREVTVDMPEKLPCGRFIPSNGGRVRLTRSGRKRVQLMVQSFSAETASELCAEWSEKVRRLGQ